MYVSRNLFASQSRDLFPRDETSGTPLDNFPSALNELIGEYLDPISLGNFRNLANSLNHDLTALSIRTHKKANRIFAKSFVIGAIITPIILKSVNLTGCVVNDLLQKVDPEVRSVVGAAVLIGSTIMVAKMPTLISKVSAAAFRKLATFPPYVWNYPLACFGGWMTMHSVCQVFVDSIPSSIALTGSAILSGWILGELALRDAGFYQGMNEL